MLSSLCFDARCVRLFAGADAESSTRLLALEGAGNAVPGVRLRWWFFCCFFAGKNQGNLNEGPKGYECYDVLCIVSSFFYKGRQVM